MNRKKKLHLWFTCLWLVGLICLLTSRKNTEASTAPTQSDMIAAGSKLFTPTCSNAYCHGKDGAGGSAPALRGKSFTADYVLRVIANGVAGTPMPAFKNAYSPKEIEQLAAYVMWLSKQDAKKPLPPLPIAAGEGSDVKPQMHGDTNKMESERPPTTAANDASSILLGDAEAGRKLFFDSSDERSCRVCHAFQGRGGKLAPDLTNVGSKPVRELFQSIVTPGLVITANYETIALTTSEGERIIGIKREEDAEVVKVFDTATLPPVLRTIQKSSVTKIEPMQTSVMPNDYAARYTLKQLLDLIAFLKSTNKPSANVSLKDLF